MCAIHVNSGAPPASLCPAGVNGVAKMLGLYQPPESFWLFDNQTLTLANGSTLEPPGTVLGVTKTLTPAPSSVS